MIEQTPDVEVDVVIVGYGPVGQYLAYKLGRLGWTTACLERFPDAYAFPRAVHFDDEVARLFQSIGLDPSNNPAVQPYDNLYRWVNAEKEVLLEVDWTGIGPSGWQTSNFFHQPDLEREIRTIVETESRAQVHRGWEAVELAQDDEGATVVARSVDGSTRTFRGRYVVGADGANSFVRRSIGIEMTDLGFEFDWLILDVFPHEPMHFDPPAWQWCRPERPTTVVPGGAPHRRRWEYMRMPGETIEELNTEATAWERLAEFGLTPENADLERHVVYTFRARWCEEWRRGRALLAGDAAHLMPPFAGQGMCAGLRDAENLLWKLDAILDGRSPDALLDSYGPERTEHVRYFIEFSMGLGRVICVSDPEAAAIRDLEMRAVIQDPSLAPPEPAPPHLGPGLHGGHPLAGHLSHQGRVTVDGRSGRFDDVCGYGWTVLARPGALDGLSADTRAWCVEAGVRLFEVGAPGSGAQVSDDEGRYDAWLSALDAPVVVVRPDFYLYDAVPGERLDEVLAGLRVALETGAPARVTVG